MPSSAGKPPIQHILVTVDGSKNAARAVKVASQIAKNNKAELTVLHVLTLPWAAYSGDVSYPVSKLEEDAKREGEQFIAAAAAIEEQSGVKAKTAIAECVDSPVKGIVDYADENNIDLIVVGTRGLGQFKRLLLGSVASGLVQYAHCSVLVVR